MSDASEVVTSTVAADAPTPLPPEGIPWTIEQEMRFAVVMYGGVSLAIYINGVAQELLRLVRATAPAAPTGDAPTTALLGGDELVGTEKVYRRLGQLIGGVTAEDRPSVDVDPKAPWQYPPLDAPIRTRFVVDVISGSSAGGINGIFLAKALANEQNIDRLRDLWVDEGDIGMLVNDKASYEDMPGLKRGEAASVLNSQRLYWQALSALNGMKSIDAAHPPGERSRLVDELDLWVTLTDIRGLLLPIDLFDRVVYEKRHRHVLHFVYSSDHAAGADRNDFELKNDPILAFAARATSAFPFAFEPMALDDIDGPLNTEHFAAYAGRGAGSADWEPFFKDYVDARSPLPGGGARAAADTYRSESFGDGGYLDNKPFSWATRTIGRRRADGPVDRRLIYIEPDPGGPPARLREATVNGRNVDVPAAWSRPGEKVDPLTNVQAALTGLPRAETIRDDLEQLISRSRDVARVRDLTKVLDRATSDNVTPWFQAMPRGQWLRLSALQLFAQYGPQYAAYHRLKINAVLDDLAVLVCRLFRFDPSSDFNSAVRCLLQAWFNTTYREETRGDDWADEWGTDADVAQTQTRFLFEFDVSYRLRRLRYLNLRCEELLRFDAASRQFYDECRRPAATGETIPPVQAEYDFVLRTTKRWLNELFIRLRRFAAALNDPTAGNPILDALNPLREKVTPAELLALLSGAHSKEESVARGLELIETRQGLRGTIDDLGRTVADTLAPGLRENSRLLEQMTTGEFPDLRESLIARGGAAETARLALEPLEHVRSQYELYDSVRFPFNYGISIEENLVEIIRVSPQDARSLIDETDPAEERRKLAGVAIHHFGGFFERHWRKNDLLWGRLDGAERLIETILPPSFPSFLRDRLVSEAQREIIREEFATDTNDPIREELTRMLLAQRKTSGSDRPTTMPAPSPQRLQAAVTSANDPEAIRQFMKKGYEVDRDLDRRRFLSTLSRATSATGRVLDGVADTYKGVKTPARWLSRVGRFSLYAVGASTPRSFANLLARYWLGLLLIVAGILIFGGPLVGSSGAAKTGWFLLLTIAVAQLLLWVLDDVLHRHLRAAWVAFAALVIAVIGLAVIEVKAHVDDDAAFLVAKLPQFMEDFLRWLWPWD